MVDKRNPAFRLLLSLGFVRSEAERIFERSTNVTDSRFREALRQALRSAEKRQVKAKARDKVARKPRKPAPPRIRQIRSARNTVSKAQRAADRSDRLGNRLIAVGRKVQLTTTKKGQESATIKRDRINQKRIRSKVVESKADRNARAAVEVVGPVATTIRREKIIARQDRERKAQKRKTDRLLREIEGLGRSGSKSRKVKA